jgi:hypothetical protein
MAEMISSDCFEAARLFSPGVLDGNCCQAGGMPGVVAIRCGRDSQGTPRIQSLYVEQLISVYILE